MVNVQCGFAVWGLWGSVVNLEDGSGPEFGKAECREWRS